MTLLKWLHTICQQIWKFQQGPQDQNGSVFIPISKKGNSKEYWGLISFRIDWFDLAAQGSLRSLLQHHSFGSQSSLWSSSHICIWFRHGPHKLFLKFNKSTFRQISFHCTSQILHFYKQKFCGNSVAIFQETTVSAIFQETTVHFMSAAAAAKSLQSCPTLCDPIDGSPPGSAIPGILQARTLEWVAISFSKEMSTRHESGLVSWQ